MRRNDKQISSDLEKIFNHYESKDKQIDMIIFIPNAGVYLSELFKQELGDNFDINFIKVRRAFTTKGEGVIKKYIFKKKWLSNVFRHLEILYRLIKFKLGIDQKMTADLSINFDVKGKSILVIDDSCETGTTLNIVKQALLDKGAESVTNSVITRDLVPEAVDVDYSVYKYMLLRTKNSRDYYAS